MLALGLLLRLAWIAWIRGVGAVPASDAAWYYDRAMEMISGAGYAIDGNPTAYWPVGYPAFLAGLAALFGPSPLAGMIANVALSGGIVLLGYRLALALSGSQIVARLALLLLALYPNHIAYSSLLLTEMLFVALLLGGLLLVVRTLRRPGVLASLGAGVLFGLAGLVKSQALLLPGIAMAALLLPEWRRLSWRKFPWRMALGRGAALHLAMALVLLPWSIRNYELFGRFGILSNNGGINLLIGNNPEATGAYYLNDRIEALYNGAPDEALRNERAGDAALAYMAAHPAEAVARLPRKFWYLYRADAEGFSLNSVGLPPGSQGAIRVIGVLKILSQLWYAGLICGGIGYLVLRWKGRPGPVSGELLPLAIVLYFTVIPLLFFGNGRFHLPAMPCAVIYVAAFLAMLIAPPESSEGTPPGDRTEIA